RHLPAEALHAGRSPPEGPRSPRPLTEFSSDPRGARHLPAEALHAGRSPPEGPRSPRPLTDFSGVTATSRPSPFRTPPPAGAPAVSLRTPRRAARPSSTRRLGRTLRASTARRDPGPLAGKGYGR